MKTRLFILLWIATGMVSCTSVQTDPSPANEVAIPAWAEFQDSVASENPELLGNYAGYFRTRKLGKRKKPEYDRFINISIDWIGGRKVSGHCVFEGILRPFSGSITQDADSFKVDAAEPPSSFGHGELNFVVDPKEKALLGTWSADDQNLPVYGISFELSAISFVYDANRELPQALSYAILYNRFEDPADAQVEKATEDATRFNASKVKLKAEDIENMYLGDLEIMRSAILARHGHAFKDRDMRQLFDSRVSWYVPLYVDVNQQLTPLEKENIALIKRYENHASPNYSDFSR
jgi:YARHG domain